MPASWVQDEDIWDKAEKAFKESYPEGKPDDAKYAIITQIYKQMGGEIKSQASLAREILTWSRKAVWQNDIVAAWVARELAELKRNA